jgi:AraC-like DNA-binding protein
LAVNVQAQRVTNLMFSHLDFPFAGPDTTMTTPIPRTSFSVADIPDGERFAIWRESISCIFEVDAQKDIRDGAFSAQLEAYMMDSLFLAQTSSLQQNWHRSSATIANDGMDHVMIQLFQKGTMAFDQQGSATTVPEEGLIVFDLAREAKSITNEFQNLSLVIPRALIEPYLAQIGSQHLRVFSSEEPMVRLLRDHMKSLYSVASDMTEAQARQLSSSTVGLATACLNGTLNGSPENDAGIPLAQVAVARKVIDENLHLADLSPDDIAKMVGVARSKLYQMFEFSGGVVRYIRERRLRRVADQLANPALGHRPVYDIALANGFANASSFTRSFKDRFGISPTEYRRALSPAGDRAYFHPGARSGYEAWLHGL